MQTPQRHTIVHAVLVVFAAALVAKAAQVQLVQHRRWSDAAVKQHTVEATLVAPRGDIVDAAGVALAHSRQLMRLSFALDVVPDRRALYRALLKVGVSPNKAKPVLDGRKKWYDLRDPMPASVVSPLLPMKGVRATSTGGRVYVQSEGTQKLLGRVSPEGTGIEGLELLLDSLLRGTPGRARTFRDKNGKRFESADVLTEPPRGGHTVRLTINQTLQDICDQSIRDASRRLDADGGDVVILDPHSGEIRCLASHRRYVRSGSAATIIEPFEPGSTLKPFLVGRLVESGRAEPGETIETFNGVLEDNGRRITDVHKAERMTVSDVIRHSSNVGIARLSERVSDGELFQLYRDLGFGTPSGVSFPVEAAGRLSDPKKWSKLSHASLAIGYELSVTPLQLALAYAAIANGGELVGPALIEEIRDVDGEVVFAHRPRTLRRIFAGETTRTIMTMLESVVDSGTAQDASLATFTLAGKSGTARRTTAGRYGAPGRQTYTSSFVGLFPARSPQYVVLVKLDNPRGSYYGGKTAAPVAKAVIQAALAARDASLDWANLPPNRASYVAPATDAAPALVVAASPDTAAVGLTDSLTTAVAAPTLPHVPLVDSTPEPTTAPPARFALAQPLKEQTITPRVVAIPDVRGLPLRVAVRELHRAGFRVQLTATARGVTAPTAGTPAETGTLVRLGRS